MVAGSIQFLEHLNTNSSLEADMRTPAPPRGGAARLAPSPRARRGSAGHVPSTASSSSARGGSGSSGSSIPPLPPLPLSVRQRRHGYAKTSTESAAEAYLYTRVESLMEGALKELFKSRPEDPVQFLLQYLSGDRNNAGGLALDTMIRENLTLKLWLWEVDPTGAKARGLERPDDEQLAAADAEAEPLELALLHFGAAAHAAPKREGDVGGAARLLTAIRNRKRMRPLVLGGGNCFGPSLEGAVTRGAKMVGVLNELGVRGMCLGQHDFCYGMDRLRELSVLSDFPFYLCNVIDEGTGAPPGGARTHDVIHHELDGGRSVKVGVLGLADEAWLQHLDCLPPSARYRNFVKEAQKYAWKLRELGAELVVALTKMGIANDKRLAEEVTEIDLILGSGSQYARMTVNGVNIVYSGKDFAALSLLQVTIPAGYQGLGAAQAAGAGAGAKRKERPTVEIESISIDNLMPEDPKMIAMLEVAHTEHFVEMDRRVVISDVPLDLRHTSLGAKQSAFGVLVAEATLHYFPGADCALIDADAFTADRVCNPGPISAGDLVDFLGYDDPLVLVGCTGKSLLAELESSLDELPRESGGYLQMAGIRYAFDSSQEPGERIRPESAEVRTSSIGNDDGADGKEGSGKVIWEPLVAMKGYRVAMRDSLRRAKFRDGNAVIGPESGWIPALMMAAHFQRLAVLGALRMELNGDKVTQEQLSVKQLLDLRTQFTKIDVDKDGEVSLHDLRTMVCVDFRPTDDEMREIYREITQQNQRTVNVPQWLAAYARLQHLRKRIDSAQGGLKERAKIARISPKLEEGGSDDADHEGFKKGVSAFSTKAQPLLTSIAGAYPRSFLVNMVLTSARELEKADRKTRLDSLVGFVAAMQDTCGISIVSDGHWTRENFSTIILEIASGFSDVSPNDGVPRMAITSKLVQRKAKVGLLAREAERIQRKTKGSYKMALPSPSLLGELFWVLGDSSAAYPTKTQFIDDCAGLLLSELKLMADSGAQVEFVDPHIVGLCGVHYRKSHAEPDEEMALSVRVMNRVIQGVAESPTSNLTFGLHLCRRVSMLGGFDSHDVRTTGDPTEIEQARKEERMKGDLARAADHLNNLNVDSVTLDILGGQLTLLSMLHTKSISVSGTAPWLHESEDEIFERLRTVASRIAPNRMMVHYECGFEQAPQFPVDALSFESLRSMTSAVERLKAEISETAKANGPSTYLMPLQDISEEGVAATKLQAMQRGKASRRNMRAEAGAAATIQSAMRGRSTRKATEQNQGFRLSAEVAAIPAQRRNAASIIQSYSTVQKARKAFLAKRKAAVLIQGAVRRRQAPPAAPEEPAVAAADDKEAKAEAKAS